MTDRRFSSPRPCDAGRCTPADRIAGQVFRAAPRGDRAGSRPATCRRCTRQPTEGHFLHAHPAVHPRPGAHRSRRDRARAASPPASPSPSAPRSTATERVWYAEHHNMPSIASSATSVLIAHVAAQHQHDPARRRRGHAAQPLAAGHRRAVRHARRAVPRPHRPRPRPGAGQRPEHDVRAAPRPDVGRHVPPGRAGAAGLPGRARPAMPGVDAIPGKGSQRAALHPRARRCSAPRWPPRSASRTPSPRTSRPQALRGRRRRLPARVPAVRAARPART